MNNLAFKSTIPTRQVDLSDEPRSAINNKVKENYTIIKETILL